MHKKIHEISCILSIDYTRNIVYNTTVNRARKTEAPKRKEDKAMTATEIKKLYTKTKKAYEKRTGDKHTWVMNAKQQRLGTATVLVAGAFDNVQSVERAKAHAAGKAAAEAKKTWLSFKAHADEEAAAEAAGNASTWNPRFWRDEFDKMGTMEEYMDKYQRKADEVLKEAQAYLGKHGPQHEQLKESHEYAKGMIASPEISAFLLAIGGRATIEDKQEYSSIYTYIRFHYQPTEN